MSRIYLIGRHVQQEDRLNRMACYAGGLVSLQDMWEVQLLPHTAEIGLKSLQE